MEEIIRFFRNIESLVYLGLGLLAAIQIRKFFVAWNRLREAAFGLERESAQAMLNRAAGVLVFTLVMAVGEFALVSFVAPAIPGALPVWTPTVDVLATPTITLQASALTGTVVTNGTPVPTVAAEENGCAPGSIEIISPKEGDVVSGVVDIIGTADVPNFGFYKFEVAALGDTTWMTIQAGETITTEGRLGYWDTSALNQGNYILRLVVTDNQGKILPPCAVQVQVSGSTESP